MENEYNKRFKNKEMSNDDFDVEGLWDDIAEELDETDPIAPNFPWSKLGGSLFLLLTLAVIGFIGFDFSSNPLLEENTPLTQIQHTQQEIKEKKKKLDNKVEKKSREVNQSSSTQNLTTKETIAITTAEYNTTKSINNIPSSSINSSKKVKLSNRESETLEGNSSAKLNNNSETQIASSTGEVIAVNKKVSESKRPIDLVNQSIFDAFQKEKKKKRESITPTSPLFISINKLTNLTPTISDSLLYVGIREIPTKKINEDTNNKKDIAFEAGILGGINSMTINFSSTTDADYAANRNRNENQILGSLYGVQLAMLYKSWRVSTGTEYHNIWTNLDTQISNDTSSVFVSQALTLVRIDSTGSVLSREFQDSTVNANSVRTVLHHNNFQLLRIPLEIGRYRAGKKWAYGFSAGTSFNFLINQSGKILDSNNELLEFSKNADNVLFQSFGMSLRANVIFGYKLRENVLLSLSPQWSWTRSNIFDKTLKTDTHQGNLILSLRTLF